MKRFKILLAFSGILISMHVFFLLKDAGVFKKIHAKSLPYCKSLPVVGAEDMADIPNSDFILISSDQRFLGPKGKELGSIKAFSKTKEDLTFFLEVNFPKNFYPHGIDIKLFDDVPYLAVVNHPTPHTTTIELFTIDTAKKEIVYNKTFSHPEFITGNDIALLNKDEFLLTRDFNTNNPLFNSTMQYLRIATGSILHYNMKTDTAKEVTSSLYYANGIVYHQESQRVYSAEMLGRRISSYNWDGKLLTPIKTLQLSHGIDNLSIYKNKILAAGHPKLLDLKKMSEQRNFKSASVIIEADFDLSEHKIIYENSGEEVASSSIAFQYSAKQMLIGNVFDNHLLACNID